MTTTMLEVMATNGAEVSDVLSDNDYDEANLQLLREDDHRDVDTDMDKMTESKTVKTEASVAGTTAEGQKKYDPKDPLRPRRKKARRACFACQRAHLTCGDERPCQRCIKRGLADGCQDGVRKKAKYLHDAPAEALRPVLGPNFNAGTNCNTNTTPNRPNGHRHPSSAGSDVSASNVGSFYTQSNAAPYNVFPTAQTPSATLPENLTFPNPQSPVSPSFGAPPGDSALGRLSLSSASGGMASFSPALFDPSNPALFNFNLEGINFGSQYAAMEFGMLGHMSSGAADDPIDPAASLSAHGNGTGVGAAFSSAADVFGNGANQTLFDGSSGLINDFVSLDAASAAGFYQPGLPHAYAIAAAPASLQSPSTDNNSPQPTNSNAQFEGSPTTATYGIPGAANGSTNGNGNGQATNGRSSLSQQQQSTATATTSQLKTKSAVSKLLPQSILGKRHRDPSAVYDMVKEPYMYVSGFHRLIALLHRRFAANKTLRIAKALSSIRPSFISCTRTLNRQDLVFMEKCFQRTLFEYEDFMMQASSPTIVCRRTGEVAAVNKEFTALTGWTKEVLLGKEPNLNVNMGTSAGAGTGATTAVGGNTDGAGGTGNNSTTNSNVNSGRAGLATPRLRALNAEMIKASEGKPQPMFIAELMDDDNVIEFYEDFAHLAFGDSRGSVNRKCRLLKYRTREILDGSAATSLVDEPHGKGTPATSGAGSLLSNRVARIDGEHGISKIERDGKLECSYCWHIRRDTFDIPMMIVMNFLPCYYPNQEPHQLAV